jgi:hypothetical protein
MRENLFLAFIVLVLSGCEKQDKVRISYYEEIINGDTIRTKKLTRFESDNVFRVNSFSKSGKLTSKHYYEVKDDGIYRTKSNFYEYDSLGKKYEIDVILDKGLYYPFNEIDVEFISMYYLKLTPKTAEMKQYRVQGVSIGNYTFKGKELPCLVYDWELQLRREVDGVIDNKSVTLNGKTYYSKEYGVLEVQRKYGDKKMIRKVIKIE